MAKKNVLNKAPMCEEEKKNRNFKIMVEHGEKLASVLMDKLSSYGCSPEALMVETYAMGMAWAALKAMCKYKGYEPKDFFQLVADSYEDEMNEFIEEIEGEK